MSDNPNVNHPTLAELLEVLTETKLKIRSSGPDANPIPDEVRKMLGDRAPKPAFFACVEFDKGDVMSCFGQVFEPVVSAFGRGVFKFAGERHEDGIVTVLVERKLKDEPC